MYVWMPPLSPGNASWKPVQKQRCCLQHIYAFQVCMCLICMLVQSDNSQWHQHIKVCCEQHIDQCRMLHNMRQCFMQTQADRLTLSRLWNTREFLKATTDQARGPAAYAKVTCTTQQLYRPQCCVQTMQVDNIAVSPRRGSLADVMQLRR